MAVTNLHVMDVNFLFRTIFPLSIAEIGSHILAALSPTYIILCAVCRGAKINLEGARVALKQSDGYAMQIIRCRLADRISQSNKMARR